MIIFELKYKSIKSFPSLDYNLKSYFNSTF